MTSTLLAWYRLRLRLSVVNWVTNVVLGLLIPGLIYAMGRRWIPEEAELRVVLGATCLAVVMLTMRQVAFGVAQDREFRTLELLHTTPLSRGGYICGLLLEGVTLGALPVALLLVGVAAGVVAPPAGLWWLLPYLGCVAAMTALGLLLGAVSGPLPQANLFVMLAMMLQFAFLPLTYPVERAPEVLRGVLEVFPPVLAADLMAATWLGNSGAVSQFALLSAWIAVLCVLGIRAIRWQGVAAEV